MAAHCSILAWRMPWMEGYSPLGCKELNMAEVTQYTQSDRLNIKWEWKRGIRDAAQAFALNILVEAGDFGQLGEDQERKRCVCVYGCVCNREREGANKSIRVRYLRIQEAVRGAGKVLSNRHILRQIFKNFLSGRSSHGQEDGGCGLEEEQLIYNNRRKNRIYQ